MKREVDITGYGIKGITHIMMEGAKNHQKKIKLEGYAYNETLGKRTYKSNRRIKKLTVILERELTLNLQDIIGRKLFINVYDRNIIEMLYKELRTNRGYWSDSGLVKLYLGLIHLDAYLTYEERIIISGLVSERHNSIIK